VFVGNSKERDTGEISKETYEEKMEYINRGRINSLIAKILLRLK
jgi:hypothetical protein